MIALYRKYRPQTFAEVVGQSVTKQTLTRAIQSGRTVHSYLFAGPRGTGKTTMARIFAKALNCENRADGEFEPCNTCASCTAINSSSFVDLIEIDAASNRGIDEIRNIKESVRFAPSKKDGYKIYIIDESHMLTKDASNALLKTLEEPPHNVIFILATTDPQKMIPTIHSRVQRFDFTSLSAAELRTKLETITQAEGVTVEPDVINRIVISAMGGARDAESLLGKVLSYGEPHITSEIADQLLGRHSYREAHQLLMDIATEQPDQALSQLHTLYQSGHSMEQFATLTIQTLRYVFLASVSENLIPETDLLPEERQRIIDIAKLQPTQLWGQLLEAFESRKSQMSTAYLPHLPFELAIVETCVTKQSFAPTPVVQEVSASPVASSPAQPATTPQRPPQISKSTPPQTSQPPKEKPAPKPVAPLAPPTPATPATPVKPNPFRSAGAPTPAPTSTPDAEPGLDFLNKPKAKTPETPNVQETPAASGEINLYTVQSDLPKVIQKIGESFKTLVPTLNKIKPVKVADSTIYFEVSSSFFKSQLEKRSVEIIQVMEEFWKVRPLKLSFVEPGSIQPQEVVAPTPSMEVNTPTEASAEVAPTQAKESLTDSVDDIFGDHLV